MPTTSLWIDTYPYAYSQTPLDISQDREVMEIYVMLCEQWKREQSGSVPTGPSYTESNEAYAFAGTFSGESMTEMHTELEKVTPEIWQRLSDVNLVSKT